MPYELLAGVRVLEVALLAPDSLGALLADMGAEVIKVEEPPDGDRARRIGATALGTRDGLAFLHVNWNRGKKSVALNLKTQPGRAAFLGLAAKSQVVIEGLRAGSLDRWGVGYEVLRRTNPSLVFCSLSGFGRTGPYKNLAAHGVLFDSYAGNLPPEVRPDGSLRPPTGRSAGVGMLGGSLYAAVGVLAALNRAARTGEGALVEVAEAEVAALWNSQRLQTNLNRDKVFRRSSYGDAEGLGFEESVRYTYYATKDDRAVLFMPTEAKFWDNFLTATGRQDLKEKYPPKYEYDHQVGNEGLRQELMAIFRTKTQAEWVQFFIENNVPGGPVNSAENVGSDPHLLARDNFYTVDHGELGNMTLVGSPIKVEGEAFTADPAPTFGQHTDAVLRDVLAYTAEQIAEVRDAIPART